MFPSNWQYIPLIYHLYILPSGGLYMLYATDPTLKPGTIETTDHRHFHTSELRSDLARASNFPITSNWPEGRGSRTASNNIGWLVDFPSIFSIPFFNMSKNMLNPQHSEIYLSYIHILLFSTQLNYPVFFGLPKHLLSICAIFGRNLVFCDLIHVKWFWSKSQGICAENRINSNSISPHMAFVNYPLWFYGFCKKGPP